MAEKSRCEVTLVTGGGGFLGQHVVRHLLNDEKVKEIRIVDKFGYKDSLGLGQTKRLVNFEADLCEKEKYREAVRGVDVVLHCAALVSYEFPADKRALHRNNVTATKILLDLCIEENVSRFVHCSTTEVTLQPCFRGGIVAMVVYSQESRAEPPKNESRLLFGEYAASKLRAEKIVCAANGTPLKNGGILYTVSLRPPLLYGEGDKGLIWKILQVAKTRGNSLIELAGDGGKQQIAYVGNAAWAFICAKNALVQCPEGIGGLPIFITDDTTVENLFRFCERLTRNTEHHVSLSMPVRIPISYFCAFIAEMVMDYFPLVAAIVGRRRMPVSPRCLVAYLGSIILHNRSRASIHINYSPIFGREAALNLSSGYYSKIFRE
ncbi:3 beta-hydroxysteroid dehydrogenase/Delta 5--_4-isomerase type 4 [Athalia rosae]|uniref:3 beta-hydroxysteroid dehydrogenase/Delta 5-->4-isomerase type 4 n=1 Tax=Athalia rosae TaxID=37344 RepID=UPI0020347CAE|nr:3 beta-hydroxysteroid dehydrogenase/Delta 5-->4-isomerase type 4 [Athalia rosae]